MDFLSGEILIKHWCTCSYNIIRKFIITSVYEVQESNIVSCLHDRVFLRDVCQNAISKVDSRNTSPITHCRCRIIMPVCRHSFHICGVELSGYPPFNIIYSFLCLKTFVRVRVHCYGCFVFIVLRQLWILHRR